MLAAAVIGDVTISCHIPNVNMTLECCVLKLVPSFEIYFFNFGAICCVAVETSERNFAGCRQDVVSDGIAFKCPPLDQQNKREAVSIIYCEIRLSLTQ